MSKFIHGTAVLFPELVQAVPYWVDDEVRRRAFLPPLLERPSLLVTASLPARRPAALARRCPRAALQHAPRSRRLFAFHPPRAATSPPPPPPPTSPPTQSIRASILASAPEPKQMPEG